MQATGTLVTGVLRIDALLGGSQWVHPGEQIVRHAEDWEAELIVVGHRGRTFLDRLLMGSVARYAITHAPCAVLVAR